MAIVAGRYRVQYDPGIFRRHRYLAGDDARRLAELKGAFADPTIRAIFCARGGYGAMRLLPQLEADPFQNSKPIVGFSDITALHQWQQCHGLISIHGPVLTQLGRLNRATSERLFSLLESSSPAEPLHGRATFVEGTAEGPLLGGNLSVFTRLLGTPFMPNLDGAVLLLEDVGERPYRLDRMWTHLELAGVFRQVRGIALGSFTHCEERNGATHASHGRLREEPPSTDSEREHRAQQEVSYTSEELLRELAMATGLPCVAGFPIGHGDINEPVPLGARVRLDGAAGQLTFLESAVSEQ